MFRRSRRSSSTDSIRERLPVTEWVRAVPWAALAQGFVVIARRWGALTPKERARLGRLARETHVRHGRLSDVQRAELLILLRKLQIGAMARELFALKSVGDPGRRRSRRHR